MKQIPILMYHWFRDGGASRSRSPQLEITPQLFERQLAWLARRGYRTVGLDQAIAAPGAALPGRPIVLTFDDGTADFWTHARPALERHGFRASLFVVSDFVGGESSWDAGLGEPARPLMDWPHLRELAAAGHEIGSHTCTHRPLVDLNDDEARDELARSRQRIADELGTEPAFFAYPRGFYEPRHKRLAEEAGYRGACAVVLGWGQLRRSDRYELKRMTIKGNESMSRFRLRLMLAGRVRFSP